MSIQELYERGRSRGLDIEIRAFKPANRRAGFYAKVKTKTRNFDSGEKPFPTPESAARAALGAMWFQLMDEAVESSRVLEVDDKKEGRKHGE